MIKRILSLLLVVLLLLAGLPAYAATGKVTTTTVTNLYDTYNSTSKAWNELKTAKHRLNGQIVYCLQHKKSVPNSQTYNLTNLMSNYSAKVQKGLLIILENGYPWERGGLSAAQAEYATANAVRFWLSECGDSQFYNQTNLGDFSNAQLRNLAANGLITKKIRVRNASYIPALQFSVELLILARAQTVMPHDMVLSASNIYADRAGDSFVGSTNVTLTNLKGGYTLDRSALPAGSTVNGYTGKDGDTLSISIPASAATANRSYALTLNGMDDRAWSNLRVFNHNSNTDYQRVLTAYLDKTIEIVAVPTGAVLDPDLTAMEERFKQNGLIPLPDTANSDYHIWQEVRLEGGAYVTKTFWAQLRTAFAITPDPRIAYEDDPVRMESGFAVQAGLQTVLTTNYDHPEKLVGVQMAWMFSPESGYGQIPAWSGAFDALEAASGAPGDWNVVWQYAINQWSETGSRLHYTPLWYPDGQYTVLSQAFYAWSPAGQLYWYDAASVDILGDMYDRVTAIQGR